MGSGISVPSSDEIHDITDKYNTAVAEISVCVWDKLLVRIIDGKFPDFLMDIDPAVRLSIKSGDNSTIPVSLECFEIQPCEHTSRVVKDTNHAIWDESACLVYRRAGGQENLTRDEKPDRMLFIEVVDTRAHNFGEKNIPLVKGIVPIPEASREWVKISVKSPHNEHNVLNLALKTCLADDKIITEDSIQCFEKSSSKTVLNLSGCNTALLRTLTNQENSKCVLWVPGLNNTFYHTHYAEILQENGFDLYVLDLRESGACRREFPEKIDPRRVNFTNDIMIYEEELNEVLEIISNKDYEDIVLYSEDVASLVVLNYIRKFGKYSNLMTRFIFNSPLLSIDNLSGKFSSEAIENEALTKWDNFGIFCPMKSSYLDMESILSWNFYQFSPSVKSFFKPTLSKRWFDSVVAAHKNIKGKAPEPVTLKPFLLLRSRHSSMLCDPADNLSIIGPAGTVITVSFSEHDVLSCYDSNKCNEVKGYVVSWLLNS